MEREAMLRANTTGATDYVPASALFVLIGAEPHTDWLPASIQRDDRGFQLTGGDLRCHNLPDGWSLQRPLPLERSLPGVFLRLEMSVSSPSSASPRLLAKARSPPPT
jgi:thioredoxin reductase (NADPH)